MISLLKNPWRGFFLRCFIALAILLLITKPDAYYEQDQLAKVTQVMCLAKEPSIFELHNTPDYYRRDLFSAFYIIATLFYKVTPFSPVEAVNILSVLCGATFLSLMPWLLGRILGTDEWPVFFALLNVPALMVTFSYGNEAAVALACFALAACLASLRSNIGCLVAAGAFSAAVFSRTDYVLLFPILVLLASSYRPGGIDLQASWRRVLVLSGTALVIGLSYFAVFIKHKPAPGFFEYHTDPKLFCAFVIYGTGISTFLCGIAGVALCFAKKRLQPLLILLAFVQFTLYATQLTSPKYILPSIVAIASFSVIGMLWLWRRSRSVAVFIFALPWFISFSPYGIFAGQKAALWYLPTDAGPIPTGGYLWFYSATKSGFFQKRYDQEIEQIAQAMPIIDSTPTGADLVGYFQPGSLRIWSAEHHRWEIPPEHVPFVVNDFSVASPPRKELMLKASYLYSLKQHPSLRDKIAASQAQRQIASVTHEEDPFPDVIEIGPSVPAGDDLVLGRRIDFLNQRSNGEQWVRREKFIPEYAGTAWIRSEQYQQGKETYPKPIYADRDWVAFSENVPDAIFYSLRFPLKYSKNRIEQNVAM